MGKAIYRFWADEEAQDLVEYTLLLALMALGAVGMLRNQGAGLSTVWVTTNAVTHNASVIATS